MKRLALTITAALGAVGALCLWRGRHNPLRHFLGGHRCIDCGRALADLDEAGTMDGGRVHPVRRTFERDHEAVIRGAGY